MFELRVITSLARINWLAPNFGGRNHLASVFHQTVTLAKGRAAPDYLNRYGVVEKCGCARTRTRTRTQAILKYTFAFI